MIAIERHQAIGPLAAEWDALADRLGSTPFARPGWVRAWGGAFAANRLVILVARRDGRMVGVLPVVRGPLGGLRSATNAHTPHFEILGDDEGVVRALVDAVYSERPRAVALGCLDPAQPAWAAAVAAARAARYRVSARVTLRSPYVVVGGEYETYLRTRRRGFVADLRRRSRRLAEQGAVTFGPAALDELLALEATGWKARRGTAIAAHASTRAFYGAVAAWAAAGGTLRLLALRVDGRPLAVLLGVEDNGVNYLLKGGFEAASGQYSPGQLILAEAIRRAFADGLRRVELGAGRDPYKLQWTDAIRERVAMRAFAPTVGGSLEWVAVARGRPLAERAGLDGALRPLRDRALLASELMRQGGRRGER